MLIRGRFVRPPGELRRSGKPDISAGPQGEIKLLLRYRPPYDWPAMLDFLRARAIPGIERVSGDSYTRTIGLDGAQGTVRVEPCLLYTSGRGCARRGRRIAGSSGRTAPRPPAR